MSTLGQRLRNQRESRRLSRATVALATGIRAHQLSSVEHGNFDALPDEAFTGGSVRAYLEYLGLEPEQTLAEILTMLDPERLPLSVPDGNTTKPLGSEDSREVPTPGPSRQLSSSSDSVPMGSRTVMTIGVLLVVVLSAWGLTHLFSGGGAAGEIPFEPRLASNPSDIDPRPAYHERRVEPAAPGLDLEPEPTPEPQSSLVADSDPIPIPKTSSGALSISEYGVGVGIENRQLVGQAQRFTVGSQVSFWTRVRGGSSGQQVRHVWIHEGRETDSILLPLGGDHWRTYSRKNLFASSEGAWVVEARDTEGIVLAQSEFVCTSAR